MSDSLPISSKPISSKPRVAICGIHIESSTFTPYISSSADFQVTRGADLMNRFRAWSAEPWMQKITWIPVLHARALPGGVVERSAYETWKTEIIEQLRILKGQLEGLFFDIHGAMSVAGLTDAEGDLITAIRAVIGEKVLVGSCMDIHGNVSDTLFKHLDQITCYRMAPHEDAIETRRRAMFNLVDALLHPADIYRAKVAVPILLPGEKTSTRIEPAKRLYARIPELLNQYPGVTDLSIYIGYAWADQPRCHAAVVGFGKDATQVKIVSELLAQELWESRAEFSFVAPVDSLEGCLKWAKTAARPCFISDSGDNPGAGGADDVTVALAGLLSAANSDDAYDSCIYASIVDPKVARQAEPLQIGQKISFSLGGKIDSRFPGPLSLTGTLHGKTANSMAGICVAIKCEKVFVIVTEYRYQYTILRDFLDLQLDPQKAHVVMVKIGYLEPELYDMAASWKMALTPGGVDQDIARLPYEQRLRPLFPFDDFPTDPDLQATMLYTSR